MSATDSAARGLNQAGRDDLSDELDELKKAHRELDTKVKKLGKKPGTCSLELQSLKRQKLQLKDRIDELAKQKAPVSVAVHTSTPEPFVIRSSLTISQDVAA